MEYFNILANGFSRLFQIVDQIEIGGISYLSVCIIILIFALFWRFVLQPLFVPNSMAGSSDRVKKKNTSKKVNDE